MIKNSILYYGMPMTGKSTRLQKIWEHTFLKNLKTVTVNGKKVRTSTNQDLVINFWQFFHRSKYWAKLGLTSNYIHSPHGTIPAMSLPFNYYHWIKPLSHFHKRFPRAPHALLDECYCINPTELDTLIMCIRDFWPHIKIVMGSIDFDSWHNKLPTITIFRKMTEKSIHLNHKCMLCRHRIATRRLHIIKMGNATWKPFYNQQKYNKMLSNPRYHKRANMISVCPRHYHLSQDQLNNLMKADKKQYHKANWQLPVQLCVRSRRVNNHVQTTKPFLSINRNWLSKSHSRK